MKKTIAILLVAILAVSSVFAAFSGEASLGFGGNLDNGNYGFIDSAAKVKVDVDLATATAEQIADGDIYASVKAEFGLKLYSGEKATPEIEDPTVPGFAGWLGPQTIKLGLTADITEAKVAGANWEVSILGLDDAPNYAKGFQTYTVEKGIDKWGFERADFDENYNTSLTFDKATGVQATVFGYKVGFGLIGDYDDEDTWKFEDKVNFAALFETPEYNISGLTFQLGAAYSYKSYDVEEGTILATKANNASVSGKVGFAADTFTIGLATDMGIAFIKDADAEFNADVTLNFNYDFLTVDAYYGTNPVTGKKPAAGVDKYTKYTSEDMLSTQVKVDLNSFNVPVALTVGVNDILATQEIVAKAEVTAIEGLKLTVNGGYTIDADGRKLVGTVYEIADTKGDDIVGKWKAGVRHEHHEDHSWNFC